MFRNMVVACAGVGKAISMGVGKRFEGKTPYPNVQNLLEAGATYADSVVSAKNKEWVTEFIAKGSNPSGQYMPYSVSTNVEAPVRHDVDEDIAKKLEAPIIGHVDDNQATS